LSDQPSLHKHPKKSACGYKITETNIHHSPTPTLQFREQNSTHLKVQRTETAGFVIGGKAKAANLWVCGTELTRLYQNFNYVLTFEITSKSYEGRQHCTGNSEVNGHNEFSVVPVFIPTPDLNTVLMYGELQWVLLCVLANTHPLSFRIHAQIKITASKVYWDIFRSILVMTQGLIH
jgi:hypothetical protein